MKQIGLLLLIIALSQQQQACRSRQQASSTTTDSTTTAGAASEKTAELAITGHLADLGLTLDSHWRGINLGDDFTKVKTIEKAESFESDAKHLGYTVEFASLETADMLYYQTGGKVSAIEVDLFLNSAQSVKQYQKELESYFMARYGKPKPSVNGLIWTGSTKEQASLKDVSKGKDFGLKIRIEPVNAAVTASAK